MANPGPPRSAIRPVLVVEDNADSRLLLAALLTLRGYAVVTAENGAQGLDSLVAHRPCVVLLDLTMPVMDGIEFRARQRRLADPVLASIPVVLLTALHDAEARGSDLDAADVLQKPVQLERLLQSVSRFCRPR